MADTDLWQKIEVLKWKWGEMYLEWDGGAEWLLSDKDSYVRNEFGTGRVWTAETIADVVNLAHAEEYPDG